MRKSLALFILKKSKRARPDNFKLKSATEIKELIETSGVTYSDRMGKIVDYIDKLQETLLDYQGYIDTVVDMAKDRNVNVKLLKKSNEK